MYKYIIKAKKWIYQIHADRLIERLQSTIDDSDDARWHRRWRSAVEFGMWCEIQDVMLD